MFPYSMIVVSNMLLNNKEERQVNAPKIETLNQHTELTPQQFYELLNVRAKNVGICEMSDMICNWQGFDDLSNKKKVRFITETINPEYYSLINRLKRLFNKN